MLLLLPSVVIVFFLVVPLGRGSAARPVVPDAADGFGDAGAGAGGLRRRYSRSSARVSSGRFWSGLLFALGWEPAVLLAPGYLKRLTVAYYLQALVMHDMPQRRPPAARSCRPSARSRRSASSLIGLAVIVGVGLWLAGRTVERREYVLEQ